MVQFLVAVWLAPSVTLTEMVVLPAVVGTPERMPVVALRVRPAGGVGVEDQTYAGLPPVTLNAAGGRGWNCVPVISDGELSVIAIP